MPCDGTAMEPPFKKQKTQASEESESLQIASHAYEHEVNANNMPTGPSMTQALDLATSFKTLVEGLNGQFETEKAKVAAQAAELSAKDSQIEELHELWKTSNMREESARLQCEQTQIQLDIEQRNLESRTIELNAKTKEVGELRMNLGRWWMDYMHQRAQTRQREKLMRDLAEERTKNAEVTESLASLEKEVTALKQAKTPKATQNLEKKVNDMQKAHGDAMQKLRKKHDETVQKVEANQKEQTRKLQEKLNASEVKASNLWKENCKQTAKLKDNDRKITKLDKDVIQAGQKSEKDAQKAIEKATRETESFKTMAEKSEAKAQKYEKVFEAARHVVRSDVSRDWQDFATKMKDLSEAVKSRT